MPRLRALLAGAALVVAGHAVLDYSAWRRGLDELTQTARALGLDERRPGLVSGMRRDADNDRAALRLARAILAEELDQRWILELPEAEQAEPLRLGLERLDVASELGLASLAARPRSWEAHLVVGGSNYLRLSRRHDPRLGQERELWLGHLEEARRLAPTQPEPLRFLAATYLGSWSVLSAEERLEAVTAIEQAFRDPTSFDVLVTSWLRVAPSLSQALSIVPDDHRPWDKLKRYFQRQGDWERYCLAARRFEEALSRFMKRQLVAAEEQIRGGARERGVRFLSWVAASARPDAANTELLERVLSQLPAGSVNEADQRWLRRWLDWTLERCLDASGCPLSPAALRRLLGLSRDVAEPRRAWALAAAGDLATAEALERRAFERAGSPTDPAWTPYFLTKARLLSERAEHREALALLEGLPDREALRSHEGLLDAARAAGDTARTEEATAALQAVARREWAREDWRVARGTSRLELLPAVEARGLELRIVPAAEDSGALALLWDDSLVGIFPATHARTVELEMAVTARRHLLEIRPEAGARAATAEVRLLVAPP